MVGKREKNEVVKEKKGVVVVVEREREKERDKGGKKKKEETAPLRNDCVCVMPERAVA